MTSRGRVDRREKDQRSPGMPIATIGRLGSLVRVPSNSLDLYVFVDAGGRASERRLWGGLACIGDREIAWLRQRLDDLKKTLPNCLEPSGELKGKHVPTPIAQQLGQDLREEDRRSLFWATWCCEVSDPALSSLRGNGDSYQLWTAEPCKTKQSRETPYSIWGRKK